ncbi:MAG: response regulator, partial [Bdellovibrionales bacterium]|nr:response regulator [Bdellovibrionales bacterium]
MATILIIEDNKELQDLYSEFIEEHGNGYKVILADDGQTALEIARETPIDLVISDMNMPGMTGVGFLSMFRMKSKSTPVIIIT